MKYILILVLSALAAFGPLYAQQILLDRGVQVAGLWCFPVLGDSLTYRYLPSQSRLALNPDSLPEFSFLRYVTERPTAGEPASITAAGGGAIVNFLVLYDTPAEQLDRARALLRERLENPDINISGPVVFERGRYLLVSSILLPDGAEKREVLGTGEAPVLENSRLAFSFELDPTRAQLLMESFRMNTPDISLVFELSFSGLTDSYEAELTVDWTEVRKSQSFGAGASVYFVGADVELGFDELRRNQSIRLQTTGTHASLEGLLNTVYAKLLDLLFKKVEPERVPSDARGGLYDAIGALTGPNGPLGSRQTTGFGLNVAYQLREMNTEGASRLYFNGRSTVQRHHFVTFNIGDLWRRFGRDERFFRDVALYDPSFQQRVVHVGIDGTLEREFDRMVNTVTVRLRKQHDSGEETIKEVVVNRSILRDSTGGIRFVYLNRRDSSMTGWLRYEFQTIWQFVGGGSYRADWQSSDAAMINLYAPFQRRSIAIEGDMQALRDRGCQAVSIKLRYPFFSEERHEDRLLRVHNDQPPRGFEVTLPRGHESVGFDIVWIQRDGTRLRRSGTDDLGLIFVDEMPSQ